MLEPLLFLVTRIPPQAAVRIMPMMFEKLRNQPLATSLIHFIEACPKGAVEVEHAQNPAGLHQRYGEFGTRVRIARDVARKIVDIGHQHRRRPRRGGAAHPLAYRDPRAGGLPLERPEYQLRAVAEI